MSTQTVPTSTAPLLINDSFEKMCSLGLKKLQGEDVTQRSPSPPLLSFSPHSPSSTNTKGKERWTPAPQRRIRIPSATALWRAVARTHSCTPSLPLFSETVFSSLNACASLLFLSSPFFAFSLPPSTSPPPPPSLCVPVCACVCVLPFRFVWFSLLFRPRNLCASSLVALSLYLRVRRESSRVPLLFCCSFRPYLRHPHPTPHLLDARVCASVRLSFTFSLRVAEAVLTHR